MFLFYFVIKKQFEWLDQISGIGEPQDLPTVGGLWLVKYGGVKFLTVLTSTPFWHLVLSRVS